MALKRQQTASMFDSLKSASLNEQSEANKIGVEKGLHESTPESNKPKSTQKNVIPTKDTDASSAKIAIKKEVAERNSAKDTNESKSSVKGYDFGFDKKKETKSVRKQFVLTPSDAAWLKETARLNGISENKVIENMIKMMKNK